MLGPSSPSEPSGQPHVRQERPRPRRPSRTRAGPRHDALGALAHQPRQPEVEHLHLPVRRQHHVRRLQVPVHDARLVGGHQDAGDLLRDAHLEERSTQLLLERRRASPPRGGGRDAEAGRSPVRVAEVLCDGRRDPVGVDPGGRPLLVGDGERRARAGRRAPGASRSPRAARPCSPASPTSGTRAASAGATACSCPTPARRSSRRGPTSGASRSRTRRGGSPTGARRRVSSPPSRRRRLGRGALDRLRGHAGAGEARPRPPRPPRPRAPAEAEAAGRAAAAPRVHGAQARRAGARSS